MVGMKRQLLVAFWMLILSWINTSDMFAQYKRVSKHSGSQQFVSNSVSITYSGQPPTYTNSYDCGYGPYYIGTNNPWFNATSPLSYTFTFVQPVKYIRAELIGLAENDSVIVHINGNKYILTNANLSFGDNPCNRNIAVISNGHISGPPGITSSSGINRTTGRLSIMELNGITSATVEYVGQVYNNGSSGCVCSFLFGQIDASNNGPVCMNSPLQLWGDPTITEPGNFFWIGPNGFTSIQQNPLITSLSRNDTGVYTLTYTNGTDTFTDTTYVTFLPGPDVPVITVTPSQICKGNTMQLTATSSASTRFNWKGPNSLSSSASVAVIPNMQNANAGIYTVTVTEYSCSLSDSIDINVLQPGIHKATELACFNEGYNFNGKQLHESGIYIDTFTAFNGCDSFSELNLVIFPSPHVNVIANTIGNLCVGDTIGLTALGEDNYNWYTKSNLLGSGATVQTTLPEISNSIMAVGTDLNNCTDTAFVMVKAAYCCRVSIPTAFSPNNDDKNESFGAIAESNISNFRMEIFNRWGQRIFTTNNLNNRWDGTYNSSPAEMGAYFYKLSCQCQDGGHIEKQGDVVLIR